MKTPLLKTALATWLAACCAVPAWAQSADFAAWTAAGDVRVTAAGSALLSTAFSDESPALSSNPALLFDELEAALTLAPGSLPGDTFEGSGLQHAFSTSAATTVRFDWRLDTLDFDAGEADRAFVLIDGSLLVDLGTVALLPQEGRFSHTFAGTGSHALAILVLDVNTSARVSTLSLSSLTVSAVPEPASLALLLAGLGVVAAACQRRR